MPRELIYTSAPRGLTPGQSGYCTVSRSRSLREALIPRLEKLSYYTPDDSGLPICAYRILNIRGAQYHVLTRIVPAGLDFTKRRSFLAHHRIYEAAEIPAENPADLFSRTDLWLDRWEGDPKYLEEEAAGENRTVMAKGGLDLWITGEGSRGEREDFLARVGDHWGVTFTNCFQPGDHPEDFAIKAAWVNTPGYEAAKNLGAKFGGYPVFQPQEPTAVEEVAPLPPASELPVSALPPKTKKKRRFAPLLFFVLLGLIAASQVRWTPPTPSIQQPAPDFTAEIDRALKNPPSTLPLRLLRISASEETVSLDPALEGRLRALAGQFALRPMVETPNGAVDPLKALEESAGLLPATVIEMRAIRAQIGRVIEEKERFVANMRAEHAELTAADKKTLTDQPKAPGRLAALNLALPKASEELQNLRAKAQAVPDALEKIDRFGLFLCQSNVNTEIIRFERTP